MKILTGTDIIEINRIKESIESLGETFKNKIYTEKEIEYCESKKNAKYILFFPNKLLFVFM